MNLIIEQIFEHYHQEMEPDIKQFLLENFDIRGNILDPINTKNPQYGGPGGMIGRYDPKVWTGQGFGNRLKSVLSSTSGSVSYEVSDFGAVVVVRVSNHQVGTGKTLQKLFAIMFEDPKKGSGKLFNTSSRWITFSTPSQAASYIKSNIPQL